MRSNDPDNSNQVRQYAVSDLFGHKVTSASLRLVNERLLSLAMARNTWLEG